jgi:hypothetical protein
MLNQISYVKTKHSLVGLWFDQRGTKMPAENEEMHAATEWGVFGPEDVTRMRSGLDRAWDSLPPERRTPENMDTLAAAIVRLAKPGERDPVQLSTLALKAVMQRYDLQVLEGDETVAAVRSIELPNPTALWSRIAELAKAVHAPGRTIRVTNQLGEMVILVGVAAALRNLSSL